jgi:subtilase family serine protease
MTIPAAAAADPSASSLAALASGKVPAAAGFHEHRGAGGEADANVCSFAISLGAAHCDLHIRLDAAARADRPARHARPSATIGNGGAYDPAYLESAYNVASAAAASGGGVGQIVAIVDAYDDPNVASDLAYYRSYFGLPACSAGTVAPSSTGCVFEKASQTGSTSTSSLPAGNSSWGTEISLDVEMVSAICPKCQILLVEANTNAMSNLGSAVNEAVSLGANVVSNSYGAGEYSTETSDSLSYFNHPGVAVVASAGDNGYGVEFPAASPGVTAVGGTSLQQATNTGTRNGSETVWSGSGSGCSAYEPKPSWQTDASCGTRMVADISAEADPNTGVWTYDTYGTSGWGVYGGTSVAAPIIASFYALAGNALGSTATPASYAYAAPSSLYDVTTGSDGTCSPAYFCTAGVGYDGPTGLGTPGGSPSSLAAFSGAAVPPPPPTAPSAPSGLAASAGNATVTLSWSASSGTAPITYNVYRSTSSTFGGTPIASGLTAASYLDSGVTNGTTYYYEVTATNSVASSGASNVVSATPVAASVPGAPRNLSARTAYSHGTVLSWSAPSSNGGAAVTSYRVYRSTSSGQEAAYTTVSCTASSCSYSDTGTARRVTYYYEVAAINSVGQGAVSNQASAVAR